MVDLRDHAGPGALRRERDARHRLPYARHANAHVLALDTGAYITCLALDGAAFETADVRDLNDLHAKLNATWRNLADDQLAVWHHLVRRPAEPPQAGAFQSPFARDLDAAYRARLSAERLFVNELFVTLVLHPGREAAQRTQAWVGRLLRASHMDLADADAVTRLEDAARNLAQHLGRYGPTRLGLVDRGGLTCSQPMGLLRLLLTGEPRAAPLVEGHLGSAIHDVRLIFGREALEIRGAAEARYAGMFGIKEYPAATRPGLWDGLLSAPFPLVAAQSFAFLSKTAARAVLTRKQNQLVSARERAASQVEDLDRALDELMSNRFVMGEHQASVLVYGETPPVLADRLARTRALLADSGLVAAREDLGLEAAFWAQFPGNFGLRLRPAAITSRNFASLAPFHTHPRGRAEGNHWGPAVARLRTSAGSPFDFNFHVADLGHTFICGPSGSGKTVVQNFLLARLETLGAQRVLIDKDRGGEIFVRACGGTYLCLSPGTPTGLAPFKAMGEAPADRAFLATLVRRLVETPERPLAAAEAMAIDAALAALVRLPPRDRSIGALRALMGQRDTAGIGARLERWAAGGALGWALDGDADEVALDAPLLGVDMTHVLDAAEIRTPILMCLFHRLLGMADGRRLVVDIDEFWKALGDAAFRDLAENGLKTWRKQNALMVFATQSPADVLRAPIAHTIVEQCATKIYLPNPHAAERDYVGGFGLSQREFSLIRDELSAEQHRFLVKQGLDSVVVELDLDGLGDALAVLSGRAETIEAVDRLRAAHGDDPARWLPLFHANRRPRP